ncbi:MAG: glycosyltransferase family 39 protein, partial [Chloroflexi bacterium]|nr:glycosyltransferase family 39 protein [Chloroflexota bacterium]
MTAMMTTESNRPALEQARVWFAKNHVAVLLALILLLAAVFRLTGVKWDNDQHLHPDERFLTMVSSAIRLPSSLGEYFDTLKSPMNPYNNNFGSFVYGTAPLFVVRITAELVQQTDYWNIYIVGRVLSALFDILTCAMVFAIGRRLFDARVGLFAAFLYACAVLPIQASHFFTVDSFGNVPIVLAFWFTLDIAQGKRGWWAFVFLGIALGIAVASRINFAVFAAIIVVAALLRLATMLGSVKRVGWASEQAASKTYAMEAGTVIGDQSTVISDQSSVISDQSSVISDQSSVVSDESSVLSPQSLVSRDAPALRNEGSNVTWNTRTITLGPIIIEIESQAPSAEASARDDIVATTNFWNAVVFVGAGLFFAVLTALIVFRIAQPYAFEGLFGLNPKWVNDMKYVGDLVNGIADSPPSLQWTGRAAYLFPLYNIFNYGLGFPFATAALGGFIVGLYEILRYRRWNFLLMTLWVGGFFLYLGQLFGLVVRYYLPLYPFFAIYAGFFIFWLWDRAKGLRVPWNIVARVATAAFIAVVVGYTLFWAAAFTLIYTRPVSRVVASDWLKQNIPPNAVIANEHWDDPLPFGGYKGLSTSNDGLMDNYWEDDPPKRDALKAWLDEADYIVLSSNRLYQSIPRLPRRYPLTTKYYEWLFDGELGFDKIKEFTSYPQLFGIVFNDDSSDEAFTVYDHPKVLVFIKSARYSSEHTAQLLDSVDISELEKLTPLNAVASKGGFRMTPELMQANYAGGTWSEIFNPNDFVNQYPVFVWYVAIWLIGLLAYPYVFVAFRKFADRGYAFTKTLGVLALAWLTWTLASYRALPFERTTMLVVLAMMLVGAAVIAWFQRAELLAF